MSRENITFGLLNESRDEVLRVRKLFQTRINQHMRSKTRPRSRIKSRPKSRIPTRVLKRMSERKARTSRRAAVRRSPKRRTYRSAPSSEPQEPFTEPPVHPRVEFVRDMLEKNPHLFSEESSPRVTHQGPNHNVLIAERINGVVTVFKSNILKVLAETNTLIINCDAAGSCVEVVIPSISELEKLERDFQKRDDEAKQMREDHLKGLPRGQVTLSDIFDLKKDLVNNYADGEQHLGHFIGKDQDFRKTHILHFEHGQVRVDGRNNFKRLEEPDDVN